jgi:ribonuclease HI
MAKKRSNKQTLNADVLAEPLDQLLRRLHIDRWDLLIVGDGSGSDWKRAAGWASVSIDRLTMERRTWCGAVNRGTVNFAEIMAYLQPLEFYATQEIDRRKDGRSVRPRYIHILTDSEYCKNTGNAKGGFAKKNAGLWSIFTVFERLGFVIRWHWIRRSSVGLNLYADAVSRAARLTVEQYNPIVSVADENYRLENVDTINPTEQVT